MSTPRTLLIVTMSMCYGMELTYKLATKQLIFIINPCHVMCLLQLTVLCLNPFKSVAQHLFRIMLNGMFFPICTGSLHVFTNPEFSICISCSRHQTTKFLNSESPIFTTKFCLSYFLLDQK